MNTFSLEQVKEIWEKACKQQRELCAQCFIDNHRTNIERNYENILHAPKPDLTLPNTPVLSAEEAEYQTGLHESKYEVGPQDGLANDFEASDNKASEPVVSLTASSGNSIENI